MEGYKEIITALGLVVPGVLTFAAKAYPEQKSKVVVLDEQARRRARWKTLQKARGSYVPGPNTAA
jgi:hypothetical protein